MIKNKYLILFYFFFLLLLSCNNKNNPITTIPEKPYPSGYPDWNSKDFNWLDSCDLNIYPEISPKFCIWVEESSPNGSTLLIQDIVNTRVLEFTINNESFNLLINRYIRAARWSNDGKMIGFEFNSYGKDDVLCIFNYFNKSYYYIPVPDSFKIAFGRFIWFNGDSTFITDLMGPHDKVSYPFLININTPYQFNKKVELNYRFDQFKNLRYCFSGDSINKQTGRYYNTYLEIKNDSNISLSKYIIPGITLAYPPRISSDGKYLAFYCETDLTNTIRYKNGLGYRSFSGLGIIDLNNLNPANIVYRFFPDFTNCLHNKSRSLLYTTGAWSVDSKYFFHSWFKEDSTIQIVKRNIYTGNIEFLTNLKSAP